MRTQFFLFLAILLSSLPARAEAKTGDCWIVVGETAGPPRRSEIEPRALQGEAYAETILGNYYIGRYSGAQYHADYASAAKWYRKAAEQGDMEAQLQLSKLYLRGDGVPRDAKDAYFWALAASKAKDAYREEEPRCDLDNARKTSEKLLSPDDKTTVEQRFDKWKPSVDPQQIALAKKDVADAAYYRPAAENGDAAAQFKLGEIYFRGKYLPEIGIGVPHNNVEAEKWYRQAAVQGHALSQYRLSQLLRYKMPGANPPEAQKWLQLAAESGVVGAQVQLAETFDYGVPDRAVIWYRKAAEQGNAIAQFRLGVMLIKGSGIKRDDAEGYFWLLLASRSDETYVPKSVMDEAAFFLSPSQKTDVERHIKEWKPSMAPAPAPPPVRK